MLFLRVSNQAGLQRNVTVDTDGGRTIIRIYEPDFKTEFGGRLITNVVLSEQDAEELRRALS